MIIHVSSCIAASDIIRMYVFVACKLQRGCRTDHDSVPRHMCRAIMLNSCIITIKAVRWQYGCITVCVICGVIDIKERNNMLDIIWWHM